MHTHTHRHTSPIQSLVRAHTHTHAKRKHACTIVFLVSCPTTIPCWSYTCGCTDLKGTLNKERSATHIHTLLYTLIYTHAMHIYKNEHTYTHTQCHTHSYTPHNTRSSFSCILPFTLGVSSWGLLWEMWVVVVFVREN